LIEKQAHVTTFFQLTLIPRGIIELVGTKLGLKGAVIPRADGSPQGNILLVNMKARILIKALELRQLDLYFRCQVFDTFRQSTVYEDTAELILNKQICRIKL